MGTVVKKPFLVVMFGPEPCQNYIPNLQTGNKILLENKGGAFVIHFVRETDAGFTRQV